MSESGNLGLIVGLSAGLGGGACLVALLGVFAAYQLRVKSRKEQQACLEKANLAQQASITEPYMEETHAETAPSTPQPESVPAEAPVHAAEPEPENANAMALYNVPEALPSQQIDILRPTSRLSQQERVRDADEERIHSAIERHSTTASMPRQRAEPEERATEEVPLTPTQKRTLSFRERMAQRTSLTHIPSLRLHTAGGRSVLPRISSNFRRGDRRRDNRRGSGVSDSDSIGAPDRELPMACRRKNQGRFACDTSSYSEASGTPIPFEEGEEEVHAAGAQEPAELMPPPPAVVAHERVADEKDENELHSRILAWQERSLDADAQQAERSTPQGLERGPGSWRRTGSRLAPSRRGTAHSGRSAGALSAASHGSLGELINPYFAAANDGLVRAPSIRPQFMAETTLESWANDEDPRKQVPTIARQSPQDKGPLFGEVEFAQRNSMFDEAGEGDENETKRWSAECNSLLAPVNTQLQLDPWRTGNEGYAHTVSSGSSQRASGLLASDTQSNSKHTSFNTVSTELTYPTEGTAQHVSEKGSNSGESADSSARLSDNMADRVAKANAAWGVGSAPRLPEPRIPADEPLFPQLDPSFIDKWEAEAYGFAIDPSEEGGLPSPAFAQPGTMGPERMPSIRVRPERTLLAVQEASPVSSPASSVSSNNADAHTAAHEMQDTSPLQAKLRTMGNRLADPGHGYSTWHMPDGQVAQS